MSYPLVKTPAAWAFAFSFCFSLPLFAADKPQYEIGEFQIPPASPDEPKLSEVSIQKARVYLEQGSVAWTSQKKCISCHTNGIYMTVRPSLVPSMGKLQESQRQFFLDTLKTMSTEAPDKLRASTRPGQLIYLAAGLAEWDAQITKTLSPETSQALELMFSIQTEPGTWGTLDCWPPYESDAYHEATVAMMAAATAPGWLANAEANGSEALKGQIAKLKNYLRTTPPLHDYSRVLLLWAGTRTPGLVEDSLKAELLAKLASHQREDGGWSIRTFAAPEAWGKGNRAEKLKAEPDFASPASDGHMTGLAIIVMREAGIPATDPRIQKGLAWLKTNQRESGRWWTRSLNTDSWHYITYSGTAFPLLALQMCGELKP
jgi:squalene-hopene/tetraprenyl-beta-curcumene cyclase